MDFPAFSIFRSLNFTAFLSAALFMEDAGFLPAFSGQQAVKTAVDFLSASPDPAEVLLTKNLLCDTVREKTSNGKDCFLMNIGICGYGNLGRGVEAAIHQLEDMHLVGIFTRREPASLKSLYADSSVYSVKDLPSFKDRIDVLILCAGSATDLPHMSPELAADFNIVDSFDTHADIPVHFKEVDEAAAGSGHLALISAGWDPGLFSLARVYASAIMPTCGKYTFWGKGVSQGHSDAIRRIKGVMDARQYTVPREEALEAVRQGENPQLTTGEKHWRDCYVVAEPGADLERITREIQTMPNYFADYHTEVHFISQEELQEKHAGIPHGGSVICTGSTGLQQEHHQVMEFSLKLDSNPEFTASVLVACARAVNRMHSRGRVGCISLLDVAPADLSPLSPEEMRKTLL